MDDNTTIMRDFNTPHTAMDRSSRQNINKEKVSIMAQWK